MRRSSICAASLLALASVAPAATLTVTIEGMQFRPATLNARPGDTVVWRNLDVVPHTATAAGRFDSKAIAPGASWSWTAGSKGRADYACAYHPAMKGTVVVE
jgi:plastocyanin